MPLLGAHLSVAGGFHKAIEEAITLECQTLQIFTKNANQWRAKAISIEEHTRFRQAYTASGLRYATSHASYLINLGSPDEVLFERSLAALIDEVQRAEILGLSYVVVHPGASLKWTVEESLLQVASGLDRLHEQLPEVKAQVLIENTAGQGTTLGKSFDQLQVILGAVADPDRLGICFDTCHAFAAGYDLTTKPGYDGMMAEFDEKVGLEKLKCFHVNDSQKGLGSRVDRHDHIGKGLIGLEAFRCLLNDPRFADHPMILETPKEDDDNQAMDPINLQTLRNLMVPAK
jgi:deoxyribonuclease IV